MQNCSSIKAGTFFDPFFRFDLTVMVQIRTQITVSHYPTAWIFFQQKHYQDTQGMFLKGSTSITGMTICVQPAFITNTNRVSILATGMRTGFINGTEVLDASILTYIIVIACTGAPPAQVICDQVIFRIATVSAGGAAMKDD